MIKLAYPLLLIRITVLSSFGLDSFLYSTSHFVKVSEKPNFLLPIYITLTDALDAILT